MISDPDDLTALHLAAIEGDLLKIKQLLAFGFQVDSSDRFGFTPLYHACLAGKEESVLELLGRGADVNWYHSVLYHSATHAAAATGHAECIRILIQRGANVNVLDSDGLTPMHDAARCGSSDSIRELHAAGGCLDARVPLGLLGQYDSAAAGREGLTPMNVACASGHDDCVRVLQLI